jgi:hypothetical protein
MEVNSDLIDLLRALNAEGADYLIVGGYAFALQGRVRATKDADIFVGTDAGNAAKVWRALASFGAPLSELRVADLMEPGVFFIMGLPRIRSTSSRRSMVSRSKPRGESSRSHLWRNSVTYIGRDDLIANRGSGEAAGPARRRLPPKSSKPVKRWYEFGAP